MVDTTQHNIKHPIQFYRLHHLKAKLGISGSHIWAMVKAKTFPSPIKLSSNITAWNASEVEAWAQDRIAASRNQ